MKKKVFLILLLLKSMCLFCEENDYDFVEKAIEQFWSTLPYGTNCIKTQYIDFSGKPIANEWCRIYIYQGDETFEILTKTDDNGWIYIINLPDGEYDIDIEGDA